MEYSEVRRELRETIERAKRGAANRRTQADLASKEFVVFLEQIAVPLFRQVGNVLKVEGYPFSVVTPGASVRLMSERNADDYIEIGLDTSGAEPVVMGHSRRGRGSRILESERPIGAGSIRGLTENDVLEYLVQELEPFVER